MTNDQFLDEQKSRGFVVYRCLDCGRRMMGGVSSNHELFTGHVLVNEKSLTDDELKALDKLRQANG